MRPGLACVTNGTAVLGLGDIGPLAGKPKMTAGQGVMVGPILRGVHAPAHILTLSATVGRVANMTALALVLALVVANAGALTARRNAA